jgi:Flp pilus assembly protein TadB
MLGSEPRSGEEDSCRRFYVSIFMIVFLVLMIAWFSVWVLFPVTSGLIHILLAVAVVSLILHFVRGRHGEADLRISR